MSIFNSAGDIKMFDEQSFYRSFEKDLYLARRSVIIVSGSQYTEHTPHINC